MRNIFRYPGSKTRLADWIVSQFPDHERYVEAFAGSASVLLHKPQSTVEVINDLDNDITQFFRVLRDRGDELADWYASTPFSRDLHGEWTKQFRRGYRPSDPVERAGRFVYLRTTSVNGVGGFSTRISDRNPTNAFQSQPEAIRRFAKRMREVVVENLDYRTLVDKYDGEDAVFYFDPPYPDVGEQLYEHSHIDHDRFATELAQLDAEWLVSYQEIPASVESVGTAVLEYETRNNMRAGSDGGSHSVQDTERLVCSFDPDSVTQFSTGSQQTLSDVA